MSKAGTVIIDHIEVKRRDIERAKKIFRVDTNVEAVKKALDMATGKIELEDMFSKYRGTKIKKVYA